MKLLHFMAKYRSIEMPWMHSCALQPIAQMTPSTSQIHGLRPLFAIHRVCLYGGAASSAFSTLNIETFILWIGTIKESKRHTYGLPRPSRFIIKRNDGDASTFHLRLLPAWTLRPTKNSRLSSKHARRNSGTRSRSCRRWRPQSPTRPSPRAAAIP